MWSGRCRRGCPALAALLGYAALAAAVFWPLTAHPTRLLPRGGYGALIDVPLELFTLAWESRALATEPWRILDAPMFHPARHVLLYGPTALGVLPIFAPIYLLTGELALALNGALVVSLVLTAWTTHLVVRRWTGLQSAAAVAGAVVLTAEWLVRTWVPAAASYASLWWFPLLVARVARPIRSWRGAATIALLAWLQSLTDVIYVAPAVLAPLGVIGIARTLRPVTRQHGLALLAAAAIAFVGLVPLLAGHAWIARLEPDVVNQTGWHGPVLPDRLPGDLVRGPLALEPTAWVLLAVGAVAAVVRRARCGRRREDDGWRALAPWVVVGLGMSLETSFLFFDARVVNRPLACVLRVVPMLASVRTYRRYRIATLVGLALAAGLAFAEVVRPVAAAARDSRRRALARGLVAAAVVGVMAGAAPRFLDYGTRPYAPPSAALLAAYAARTGPVLELPVHVGVHVAAMVAATYHHRPILNGYDGYWPSGFPDRMALAERLPDDPVALQRLQAETGVTTIVVDPNACTPEKRARWIAAAGAPARGLRLRARIGPKLVFDVDPATPG